MVTEFPTVTAAQLKHALLGAADHLVVAWVAQDLATGRQPLGSRSPMPTGREKHMHECAAHSLAFSSAARPMCSAIRFLTGISRVICHAVIHTVIVLVIVLVTLIILLAFLMVHDSAQLGKHLLFLLEPFSMPPCFLSLSLSLPGLQLALFLSQAVQMVDQLAGRGVVDVGSSHHLRDGFS